MKGLRILLLLLSSLLLEATPTAIWVWEKEMLRLLDEPSFREATLIQLKHHRITTLYLYADRYGHRDPLLDERPALQDLMRQLHQKGFRVEALLGSAFLKTWEYILPDKAGAAKAMVQHVLDYNATAPIEARFDGLHLDIEPYALDEWNAQSREGLCRLYLDRATDWVGMARKANLPIGAAIPFWYDGFKVTWNAVLKPMNAHVQDLFDYVALMDYRNKSQGPDGIIAHGQDEIAYGSFISKAVVIGVETGPAEPSKVTFYGQGAARMKQELDKVRKAFKRERGFSGFAIHHLRTWQSMLSSPTP
ncbi:MAG: hypothetical protein LWX11_07375 [Firmicutes bacterium]|nr:hypothetical protein [Bacillota bacterium]